MNATTSGGDLAWGYLRYPHASGSRRGVIRAALINSVQMKKMTQFQKCLASLTVTDIDWGRENSRMPKLLSDFPEILENTESADSIYNRIYGTIEWESAGDSCVVSVEDGNVAYKHDFVEIKLDLPGYFAYELIDGYEGYAAQDREYEKEEVLEKAIILLCDKLDYMHRYFQQTAIRGLLDSHNLMIAHRRDFGGKLSLEEERRESSSHFKIKLKPGPKPGSHDVRHDDREPQDPNWIFHEVLDCLKPDFDGKNKNSKMKTCEKVVAQYAEELKLQDDQRQELVLELYGHKKSNQAALALTVRLVGKSRHTIERYISKNNAP